MNIIAVYKIKNKITKDLYIGGTVDYKKRIRNHRSKLNNNIHRSLDLQNDWNKYGVNKFEFKVLEECNLEDLNLREQYYLDNYKTKYNKHKVSVNTKRKISEESILAMRQSPKNKRRVYQYSLDNIFIKEWKSVREASRHIKCSSSQIFDVLVGKRKTCKGFYWKKIKENSINIPKTGKNVYKKIIGTHKDTKIKIEFKTTAEAAKFIEGFASNISSCLNGRGKSYKKYYWKKEVNYDNN